MEELIENNQQNSQPELIENTQQNPQPQNPIDLEYISDIANSRIVEPYLRILKELSSLKAQDNSLAGRLKINQIAIVGMQSAGKSTILEWLLRFPSILRKQNGIGSKCVTLFTCDTNNKGLIRVYLQKNGFNSSTDEFRESDYKKIIARYNQLLEEINEDISEEEIVIELGGRNLPIVIKDIPGYTVENDSSKEKTRKMFQGQLKSDDTIVVYATDISKEMMVHEEIAKELPMEKVILAFTKIDINYKQHGEKILQLINPSDESQRPLGFIGLIPPIPEYMTQNLSLEEKEKRKIEHEQNILERTSEEHNIEMEKYEKKEKDTFDDINIIKNYRKYFGRQPALKTLNKILFQSLRDTLPSQISLIKQEIFSTKKSLDDLQQFFKMIIQKMKFFPQILQKAKDPDQRTCFQDQILTTQTIKKITKIFSPR